MILFVSKTNLKKLDYVYIGKLYSSFFRYTVEYYTLQQYIQ